MLYVNVNGQDLPTIKVSRNQLRNLGDSTELKCKVENADDNQVIWLKDRGSNKSPQHLSMGQSLVAQDDRFSLKFDRKTSAYIFKIDDLQKKDAGLYKCLIQLSDTNEVSAEVVLDLSGDGAAY